MKRTKLGLTLALTLGLHGCTTMEMLGEAGDSMGNGDIVAGTFMGTFALLFGPIIDIFTLGGALDSPSDYHAVAQTAASVSQASGSPDAYQYQMLANALQPSSDSSPDMSATIALLAQQQQAHQMNTTPVSSGLKRGQIATDCLKRLESSDGHYQKILLKNVCSQTVNTAYCYTGTSGGYACDGKESVGAIQQPPGHELLVLHENLQGAVHVAYGACLAPAYPTDVRRINPIQFRCVIDDTPVQQGVR
ncbi:hypothetical protein [Zestomonas carbonaria]|uniref:Uncharacterized protein n=1 Tax=Zestomonas carbonaria TaxID=2762745 RepID=A0A7U7EPB0_9GAMM|nr:hypothetical protein [Pseudomonas carbonaria]CAD5108698.1 hypothetical protein PSEWESI4_02990 [Pseudomonas carbonaria]